MPASRLAALVAAALTLPGVPARADDDVKAVPAPPPLYGYVEVATNYVSRGLSQSVGRPSAQGEIDVNAGPGLYGAAAIAGIDWVDAVYPGADAPAEVAGVIPRTIVESGVEMVYSLAIPGITRRRRRWAPRAGVRPRALARSVRTNCAATVYWFTRLAWQLVFRRVCGNAVSPAWLLGAPRPQSHARQHPLNGNPTREFSYTDYKVSATRYFGGGLSLALAYTWSTAASGVYTLNGYNTGGEQFVAALEQDF
jgi:hypothetical protein